MKTQVESAARVELEDLERDRDSLEMEIQIVESRKRDPEIPVADKDMIPRRLAILHIDRLLLEMDIRGLKLQAAMEAEDGEQQRLD